MRKLGNKTTRGDHPGYSIIKIGQNSEKILETLGDLLSLKLQWKPSANVSVKNSQGSKIIIIIIIIMLYRSTKLNQK